MTIELIVSFQAFSRQIIVHETDPGTDTMMKILLPLFFILFKLTGTFIDFMLELSNANVTENESYSAKGLVTSSVNSGPIR